MEPYEPIKQPAKRVLVAGGGVAALEAVLALHDLAAEHADMIVVAPNEEFIYRPLSVGEPFALGAARSLPLAQLTRDLGVEVRHGLVRSVDTEARRVQLAEGGDLEYDLLLVATGARHVPAFEHVTTFRGQEDSEAVHGLVQDLEGEYVRRIAFVVPPGVAWALPIYELALMTAQRAYEMSLDDVELTLVTPEAAPLALFGTAASGDVARLLEEARVHFRGSCSAEVPTKGTLLLHPGGNVLECDRVVSLARIAPLAIEGLPSDSDGFVPVDPHGAVAGTSGVYAAGDGTSFPVKQGGLACQQADAAAEAIAKACGTSIDPRPFQPVLRGELLTGRQPRYLRADISGRSGDDSASSEATLWWPPAKIAGRYLAPYLAGGGAAPAMSHLPLRDAADAGHGIEPLGYDRA